MENATIETLYETSERLVKAVKRNILQIIHMMIVKYVGQGYLRKELKLIRI